MPRATPRKGPRARKAVRQALADITPAVESEAMNTHPSSTFPYEPSPKDPPQQSWDSPCASNNCPIKHPHNLGLRPPTLLTPFAIFTNDDYAGNDDEPYPDTEPPPLIKAMIDTLRHDPVIVLRYPRFTDVLRDFYEAHGGRSDVYHGPEGMFGLGVDSSGKGKHGHGLKPYHRHPDEEVMGGWFAFEIERNGHVGCN